MSILGRRVSVKMVAAMAALMVVAALLPVMTTTVDREITLEVRGMSFFLEGGPATPNPTITVKAGERVRVVLRNQDRGMTHDFSVPAVDAAMGAIDWSESGEVTFEVPTTPGAYEYVCRPHSLMMRGTLRVVP